MAILLAMSLTLTSCGKGNGKTDCGKGNGKTEEDVLDSYDTCLETLDILNSLFIFESKDCEKDVYEEFERLASIEKSCNNREVYTPDILFQKILENSKPSKETQESLFFTNVNKAGEELNRDRAISSRGALSKALDIIFKNSTNDFEEDICRLKDLKITLDDDLDEQILYDTKTNTLYLNYKMMLADYNFSCFFYSDEQDKKWAFDDYLTKRILLALNFCRSFTCNCRIEDEDTTFTIATFNEALNALSQAAYESNIKNTKEFAEMDKSSSAYAYVEERKMESILLLYSCFKEGRTLEDYHNAFLDTDISKLLEFFDLNKEQNGRNGSREFLKLVDSLYGHFISTNIFFAAKSYDSKKYDLIEDYMSEAYKNSGTYALQKIYKQATSDLVTNIYKKDYTKEEAIYLFDFLSIHIIKEAKSPVSKDGKIDLKELAYSQSFTENAKKIEEAFQNFIIKYYDMTQEEYLELRERLAYATLDDLCSNSVENIDATKLLTRFPLIHTIEVNHFASTLDIDFFNAQKIDSKSASTKTA